MWLAWNSNCYWRTIPLRCLLQAGDRRSSASRGLKSGLYRSRSLSFSSRERRQLHLVRRDPVGGCPWRHRSSGTLAKLYMPVRSRDGPRRGAEAARLSRLRWNHPLHGNRANDNPRPRIVARANDAASRERHLPPFCLDSCNSSARMSQSYLTSWTSRPPGCLRKDVYMRAKSRRCGDWLTSIPASTNVSCAASTSSVRKPRWRK